MLRALSVPAGNDRGPLYMDQVLAALHQGNPRRLPVTLAVTRHAGEVTLCCRFPAEMRGLIEGQLYAQYPDAKITPLPDDVLDARDSPACTGELHVSHDLFPIKRYAQFEDALNRQTADPVSAILTAIAGDGLCTPTVELTIRPARRRRTARARRCLRRLASPFFRGHHRLAALYLMLALSPAWPLRFAAWALGRLASHGGTAELRPLDTSGSRQHDREEDLQAASDKVGKLLFETSIRIRVVGTDAADAKLRLREIAASFGQFSARHASFHLDHNRNGRRGSGSATSLLSTEELATLWHPCTATVRAPTMTTVESREAEPPPNLPTPDNGADLAILGTTNFRGRQEAFGILPDDRRRHCLCVGKTGTGKTTLLRHLVQSDIVAGRGVCLMDPHGDLAEAVLATVPSLRTNDIVLFDAGDTEFPLAFNPLCCPRPEQRHLVASGLIAAFRKVWGEAFWGPRLEHILRNALLTVLEVPDTSLLAVLRILSDAEYRTALVARVSDPTVRSFWDHEFAGWNQKFRAEATAPVLNKIGAFASSPLLRNIIGQARSTIDLRAIMDDGRVLLVNLSKGRIGDDASSLLGSFLVTAIQLAAMSRADLPEDERRDFFLYIDEFQNFATDSFSTILSEARKYRLSLTVANQFLAQMDEKTLSAVIGNIGTMVVFQMGAQDAEVLADQLGGTLTDQDLLTLPRYNAYVRLLIDGHPSRPFSLRTLQPLSPVDLRRPHIIRRASRHRYGRPSVHVEAEIRRTLATA